MLSITKHLSKQLIALNDAQKELARAELRRFAHESLTADDLAAEIAYWGQQRAIWQGDLDARDFRDHDEATLRGGIAYAEHQLADLDRQADRILRAPSPQSTAPATFRADLSARFKAARYADLVDVVQTLTGQTAIKTGGGRYRAHCPFHADDSPSLVIYPVPRGWWCFTCGKGGDAVAFVAELFHLSAVDALVMLEQVADTYPDAWGQAS